MHVLKEALRRLLIQKSVIRGDFTLASGAKSKYYIDCKQTALHPDGASLLGMIFLFMLKKMSVDAVAGVTLGGDPLVTAVSLASRSLEKSLPALIVRKQPKDHGTSRWIEGLGNVSAGQSVALLEDVVTSGGSSLDACGKIEEAGLNVAGICCIIDRLQGGREKLESAGYQLHAIFTRDYLLGDIESK
ncbi:MAG: orotate phosphoribosyltransferase [Patescibacteria group bacterium]